VVIPERPVMRTLIFVFFVWILSGCATIYKGYMSRVEIRNAPDSLRVFTSEGVELPVHYWSDRIKKVDEYGTKYVDQIDSTRRIIELRSNRDHVLILKDAHQERRIATYAKISTGWAILDFLCLGVPVFVDAITGNWNYFESIQYR